MKKLLTCIFGLTMLAACDSAPPADLHGRSFQAMDNGAKITLNFDGTDDRVHGKIVNNYSSVYHRDGAKITFDMAASTMMMGIDANAMRAERDYFKFLPTIRAYSLRDGVLTLRGTSGKMEFKEVE